MTKKLINEAWYVLCALRHDVKASAEDFVAQTERIEKLVEQKAKEEIRNKLMKKVVKVSDDRDRTIITKRDWNKFWEKELKGDEECQM